MKACTKILKLQTPKLTSVHGLCNIGDVFMTFIQPTVKTLFSAIWHGFIYRVTSPPGIAVRDSGCSHACQETSLHDQKSDVRCALSRRKILVQNYLRIPSKQIFLVIWMTEQLTENETAQTCFQQDGVTAPWLMHPWCFWKKPSGTEYCHIYLATNITRFNCPWFFIWHTMNNTVHKENPRSLNYLKEAIINFNRSVSHTEVTHVFASKLKWVDACLYDRGGHFRHSLEL